METDNKKARRLGEEESQSIVNSYLQGTEAKTICRDHSISSQTLYALLKREGVMDGQSRRRPNGQQPRKRVTISMDDDTIAIMAERMSPDDSISRWINEQIRIAERTRTEEE